ncbi:MAG: 4Fe-4S dicluster domain-containing protein [Pseudodesulfovibrio sp.]|uniref:4Fe-4S dicluster domain-containing protein n=1 Tax=Pseudodesulfovibrio sp. TaxID=2035812 RepID=UPI003D14D45B
MDFLDIGLILASVVCVAFLARRVARWRSGPGAERLFRRPWTARALPAGIKYVVLDVLLLRRTARTGPVRWLAHCLVFYGFMGLLLFHAMGGLVTANLFSGYEPTLNPWQFLRDLLGGLVLAGLTLMVVRRVRDRRLRALTRFQDWALLFVVGAIVGSGILLEASKIMSPAMFDAMVVEYGVYDGGPETTALKAAWADRFGVVFPSDRLVTPQRVRQGLEVNDESCSACHSDTASAVIARPLAAALTPLAPAMNRSRADRVFWYVHILFCLIGLAALPYAKFLHPLATPANLAVRGGRHDLDRPGGVAARGLGLDACTRCGECSLHCSVAPSFAVLGNPDILPSEKLASLKAFRDGELSGLGLERFAEGSRICTECLRCTDICSAGINLQDLWLASKVEAAASVPDPNQAVRAMTVAARSAICCRIEPEGLADNRESFWACVQCTTCTSVCPVVAVSDDPSRDLDLLPQQVMNLLRMGLKDETLGARMVWSCTTCYKCQEHCPQDIRVADVLYELRNTAAARLRQAEGEEG